jgi:hypothetical protein
VPAENTGYSRQDISAKMGATNPASGRSVQTTVVTHGPALVDWGRITHLGIDDDLAAGTMLLWAMSSSARTIETGESFQLVPGQIAIQFQ